MSDDEGSPAELLAERDRARLLHFGLEEYGQTLRRQEDLRVARQSETIPDTWLIGEHPLVITQGVRGVVEDLRKRDERAREPFPPVYKIDRGGMTTLHSPGQLILYPIVRLADGSIGAGAFARALVGAMKGWIAAEFGIKTVSKPGHPGLFFEGKKLLSVGISVRQGVTQHGIALNLCNDLGLWDRIVACGDAATVPVSLEQILGRRVDPVDQIPSLAKWIEKEWGYREVEFISVDSIPNPK